MTLPDGRNLRSSGSVPFNMIRIATPADLDEIVRLHAEARATYYRGHLPEEEYLGAEEVGRSRGGWARAIDRAGATVLCAERDGVLAGIAAHAVRDGGMHLTQLHVAPDRWREGIGTELHEACVAAWQLDGVAEARLEVFVHNTRAQSFYTARGWTPDPEHPRSGSHLMLRLAVPAGVRA
ncbi:GNAT family N-acetyltransferase [Streptomyces sp. NPDC090132]|uniref:GNAT family N-acetyltransferase n=1 Tax=Streptomyces sp. NPDC090132 TaxID=3365955 RepID=UPI0037FB54E4